MRAVAACLILVAALAAAAPAGAQVRLGSGSVKALSTTEGTALVVLGSGETGPYRLVRGFGLSKRDVGPFGDRESENPDVAGAPGDVAVVSWTRPVSGGNEINAAFAPLGTYDLFARQALTDEATGPARIAVTADRRPLAAFPDRDGNVAVVTGSAERRTGGVPPQTALTSTAPKLRHLPLDVVFKEKGPIVLDLVQSRRRTELRVVGRGAPGAAAVAIGRLFELQATMAASGRTVAVAYMSRGRAVVATTTGGSWRRRRLPGPGGGTGAPSVAIRRGQPVVAYVQRVRGRRHVYVARGSRARRITTGSGDHSSPLAAVDANGSLFVAWTRRSGGRSTAWLDLQG